MVALGVCHRKLFAFADDAGGGLSDRHQIDEGVKRNTAN